MLLKKNYRTGLSVRKKNACYSSATIVGQKVSNML
jgi:hypothetical protein